MRRYALVLLILVTPCLVHAQDHYARMNPYIAGVVTSSYSCTTSNATSGHDGLVDNTGGTSDAYCDSGSGYGCGKIVVTSNSHVSYYKLKVTCSEAGGVVTVDLYTDSSGPSTQVDGSSATITGVGNSGWPYPDTVYTSSELSPSVAIASGTYWVCYHRVTNICVAGIDQSPGGPDYCAGTSSQGNFNVGTFGCTP